MELNERLNDQVKQRGKSKTHAIVNGFKNPGQIIEIKSLFPSTRNEYFLM
jgi:hypothetical protein